MVDRTMRTDRSRLAIWCCLLLVVLTVSGCFSDPPKTDEDSRPNGRTGLSVKTTTELPDVVIEKVSYRSGTSPSTARSVDLRAAGLIRC